MTLALLAVLAGCTPQAPDGADGDSSPFHDGTPSITAVEWSCDGDDGWWSFAAETDAWTNGGYVWMAREADTAERHRIYSESAAADGSSDRLQLDLEVAVDWRDADSGASTRWRCTDQDAISYLVTVVNPAGGGIADCRTWGVDPEVFAGVSGAEVCGTTLSDDTGAVR